MSEGTLTESKGQIMSNFAHFLTQYDREESRILSKEEELEKEKNKQLLEKAAEYTVDNIVNNMASLQLDFGRIIQGLSQNLTTESTKLDELKKAITVKQEQLKQLRQVRLVADALYILRQEHQEKLRQLEEKTNQQREALEKEQEKTREIWQKEQQEFDSIIEEESEIVTKQREQEAANYQYDIERLRTMEQDDYQEKKRQQERELSLSNLEKEKAWKERETLLTQQTTEYQENQKKIEELQESIKQEYNKAKGEAIKDAEREAKVRVDLIEKEWELTKQGYELRIESLEATINRNNEQITELITQLQNTTNQAQNLALRAFQGNNN
ncbi:hypothetical protein VB715_11795 [Crocosphaera sp. UHCC 0190]|uniref:hypothetical protein n=1 Tax=Crocosphaera sp. UHCC 0190 TaxID=3110246 RepID=UPI002B1FE30B|nr:hypothetical protein [Crocosphaera sp. UHCC 0190]MEA5510449.1 hypothetical protein [Crocosphaera sp. UHCC 0190]